MTQALAVFLQCRCLVPVIERRLTNAEVQVIEVPAHGLAPRLDGDRAVSRYAMTGIMPRRRQAARLAAES